jgi:Spy/CpxP family protein refolding chaperone
MNRFQLAKSDIHYADVVETNRGYFFIRSILSGLILTAKKNIPAILILFCINTNAQQTNAATDTAYLKVVADRTAKIVNILDITDKAKAEKVQQIIATQYLQLNGIHDNSKAAVATIKAGPLSKEEIAGAVKKEEENKATQLKQLHTQFIGLLQADLTSEQIEKVKDGMTYRVLPVTWAAYMDMLQKLTKEQKDKMYAWLVEARELAMDEGSSEKKHAVFGKYKGRINNYLSAEGYDMKKEGEEWAKRIQAAKEAKQNSN